MEDRKEAQGIMKISIFVEDSEWRVEASAISSAHVHKPESEARSWMVKNPLRFMVVD